MRVAHLAQIVILRPLSRGKQLTGNSAMTDEDDFRKNTHHEVGEPLDSISVEELEARIKLLELEVDRLKSEIKTKQSSLAAADAVFKI